MDLKTYQEEARVTATFDPQYKITYPALGLINEAGEFGEKYEDATHSAEDNISELGDVLWYFSAICDIAGFQVADFFSSSGMQDFDSKEFMYAAAKVAGICKKAVRDTDGIPNLPKLAIQLVVMASMMNDAAAFGLDTTIEDVAEKNIAKLRDRQSRNVIKGEGDNR